MPELRELLERRAAIVTRLREINDGAEAENRDLTAEERTNWDQAYADQEALNARIQRAQALAEQERRAAEDVATRVAGVGANPSGDGGEVRTVLDEQVEQRARAFRGWLNAAEPTNGTFQFRALQADSDPEGGYLVRPEQFVARLIQAIDDDLFIRRLASTFQVTDAESMGAPSLDTDPSDADWTAELDTGNEDTSMRFGKRALRPNPLAKRIKISKTLLRKAALGAESIVLQRLAYKFGVTQEKGFLLGNGANQPLGLFVASADGISTARDVSAGNTTTEITFDGLIEAVYTLKAGYWRNAQWLFHRNAIKQIAKLKDNDGRYLWEPSTQVGQPDRIRGFPLNVSEFVPATFTTGQYVGMFADFSYYWIADSLAFDLQRLVELYAATNQIGFIGRLETDGMPVLEEAFVRVKLA